MTYQEAIAYVEEIQRSAGIVPGLSRVKELCARLGNPQDSLSFVHVAGTNGKGSTVAFVSSVLTAAGYVVGRYISPTIIDYRERICVKEKMIPKPAFGALMEKVKAAADAMETDGFGRPSAFETETALAFLYFCERGCDIVVLETGMGGLEDATNLITTTKVAVLSSISMDHMGFLGKTLPEIATQKAGILKPGCIAVSQKQVESVAEVLVCTAAKIGCELRFANPETAKAIHYGLEKQSFSYGTLKKLEISLSGQYQIANAVLALEVIKALEEKGYPVSEKALRKGLLQTKWPGRFSVVAKKPLVIVDGAHNEEAAKRLAESISFYFTNRRILYIMGVLKDKEYEKVIGLTAPLADQIFTIATKNNPRALPAYELAKAVSEVNSRVTAADSVQEAWELAHLMAGKDDVIVVFGSLSFLGEIIELASK